MLFRSSSLTRLCSDKPCSNLPKSFLRTSPGTRLGSLASSELTVSLAWHKSYAFGGIMLEEIWETLLQKKDERRRCMQESRQGVILTCNNDRRTGPQRTFMTQWGCLWTQIVARITSDLGALSHRSSIPALSGPTIEAVRMKEMQEFFSCSSELP